MVGFAAAAKGIDFVDKDDRLFLLTRYLEENPYRSRPG